MPPLQYQFYNKVVLNRVEILIYRHFIKAMVAEAGDNFSIGRHIHFYLFSATRLHIKLSLYKAPCHLCKADSGITQRLRWFSIKWKEQAFDSSSFHSFSNTPNSL